MGIRELQANVFWSGVLEEFSSKYDEDSLPYHIVVPSLPGYCFSNGPPLDRDWLIEDTARVMDTLMKGLGFEAGYIAQGGDLGSYIARGEPAFYNTQRSRPA